MNYPVERIKGNENAISVSFGTVFSYHAHIHTYYEIILYEPFDGHVYVNERSVRVDSYTCIMVAPSDLHKIEVNGVTEAKFIKLKVSEEALACDSPHTSFVLKAIDENDFIISLFRELMRKGDSNAYTAHLVNAAILQITFRGEAYDCLEKGEKYRLVTEAARILHEEFTSPVYEEEVAKRISVSPQYLSKIFKQVFGIGFADYLSDIRLRYAANQLLQSEKSVTQICFECGCGNLSHFLRRFKEKYGLTPREYRKEKSNT